MDYTQEGNEKRIVYFIGGHVDHVSPTFNGDLYENRDIVYEADYIVSDGIPYSLIDVDSIRSIVIPNFEESSSLVSGLGATGSLDYDLRMRAGRYWNNGQYALSIACLEKATEMMPYSGMIWKENDYYRIVNYLIDLGYTGKAQIWKNWIERNVPNAEYYQKQDLQRTFDLCNQLRTDFVYVKDIRGCNCEKCAKYRNRVYRIRGFDLRFPKFPKDYHLGCGLITSTYIPGVDNPFTCENIILYSNRPFRDDRSAEEKKDYEDWAKRCDEALQIFIREPNVTRTAYYLLKTAFPDEAPKSVGGFTRMKNANSKRYQSLIKKADAEGLKLPETIEDLHEIERQKIFG